MDNLAEESKYPEILEDLVAHLVEELTAAGLESAKGREIAWNASERIRKTWSGMNIYIPKGRDFDLSKRDYEIYRRWNGDNKFQLCREYDITEQRLYQILKAVRAEIVAKTQMRLFD